MCRGKHNKGLRLVPAAASGRIFRCRALQRQIAAHGTAISGRWRPCPVRLTTSAGNRLDVTCPVAPGSAAPPRRALAPFFELKNAAAPVQLQTRSPSPFSREMLRPLTLCRASEMFVSGNLPTPSEVITPSGCGNQAPLTFRRTNGSPHWAIPADQYGSNLVPICRIDRFFREHKTS